ncbi:uncharacterized protein LOC109805401 [Cajanus cajan]|uniref:uncharacterized protein LOC109805401 n=1 Tax=Cajanus cajan TaxID=3821 RepID=UPI00098DD083|nr:uncharacterized protein LOC109805401 [Cajanus cajan]
MDGDVTAVVHICVRTLHLSPLPFTSFMERSRPVSSSEKPMARISLQGRLLHADVASAARTVGGLSAEQAIAWNLFPPIHRFLIVAVIGATVARSRKDLQICHLKKCVELRDQALSSMQQKLDSLCKMVNNFKEQSTNKASEKDMELQSSEVFGTEKIKFVDCGCWHCEQHYAYFGELMCASVGRSSGASEELIRLPSLGFVWI